MFSNQRLNQFSNQLPDLIKPEQITLDRGLTLVHQATPGSGVVAVDVWIPAGSIFESDAASGMAHFLEHMIFKGSDRVKPGMFDQAIEAYGGQSNAATGYDYAHYHMVVAAENLATTLPDLAEILVRPAIPDDQFDSERQVVLEELRQCLDNPDYVTFQQINEQLYPQHGYRRPILGTPETLAAMTPEAMRSFHRQHYQPERMTIVVVGDVEKATAIDLVKQHFVNFAAIDSPKYIEPIPAQTITNPPRQDLTLPQLEESRLIINWLTPGWGETAANLRHGYGLDLLSIVLTGGRTARLVQDLLETQGLVFGIDASYSLQRDAGLFTITAWLDEADIATVEAAIAQHMADLIAQPITPAEYQRGLNLLRNESAFSSELPEQLAARYGYYATIGQLEAAWQYPVTIGTITPNELQHLAKQYLNWEQAAITIVRPEIEPQS
jgi:zinc protease